MHKPDLKNSSLSSVILFSVFSLHGCGSNVGSDSSATKPDFDWNNTSVYIDGTVLKYLGEINAEANDKAFHLYKEHKVDSLFMSSQGGDVMSGMQLANWIAQKDLDVELGNLCASSCANYILAASKKVSVKTNTKLMWHGSSYQQDVNERVAKNEPFFVKWRQGEEAFFTAHHISKYVTICGMDEVSFIDNVAHYLGISKIGGFTYGIEDLKKFGFNNIVLKDGTWSPTDNLGEYKIFHSHYCSEVSWL